MLAGKQAPVYVAGMPLAAVQQSVKPVLLEQLAEIQDSIDFVDAKQRFYDDVLSGATPYVSVLIPSAALAKESEEPGELKGVERK